MRDDRRAIATAARGFMPADEGLALYEAAASVDAGAPFLEVGSYCGKSAVYLGTAAEEVGTVLYALDHHRGSEENQPGWQWHEPELVDQRVGKIDTLAHFRATIHDAGLEGVVVGLVGDSPAIAKNWTTELGLLFIDGGHGHDVAHADYDGWVPKLTADGTLLIHDVFPDPADGGRPPYELYLRAIESDDFVEINAVGSLRVLRRSGTAPTLLGPK